MKIAIITTFFPPTRFGGLEIATYNIAERLAARGHHVHIVTSLSKGLPENCMEKGVHIHRIFWKRMKTLGYFIFFVKILIKLKKISPDIIHIQGLWISFSGYLAKKLLNIPYILYARGTDVYCPQLSLKLSLRTILNDANAVIALTRDMKKRIQHICDREVFLIPNGIDLKKFQNIASTRIQPICKNKKTILFVGRLRFVKGVIFLLKALKLIKIRDSSVELIIIGDGEERKKLQNFVQKMGLSDSVIFTGELPNQKVLTYFAAADIFVLPSLAEGFPNVILEAMASGMPIVATRVGGIPEIMQDEINGFLIEPRDPDQIAQKVLFLFNHKETMRKISENNKKTVMQKYSWEKIALELENIYWKCFEQDRATEQFI